MDSLFKADTGATHKWEPQRFNLIQGLIVLALAWSSGLGVGCRSSEAPTSRSQGIDCLTLGKGPIPRQPSAVTDKFKQLVASRIAKLPAQRLPSADVEKRFAAILLEALKAHPLPRSQALVAVDQLLNEASLQCGPELCSRALNIEELGAVTIFETLRLEQLQALEKRTANEDPSILRSLIDDKKSPSASLVKARVVGGAEPTLQEITKEQVAAFHHVQLDEAGEQFLKFYSGSIESAARIRSASAVPAAGRNEVSYPPGVSRPDASDESYWDVEIAKFMVDLVGEMPKAEGTVYRAVIGAKPDLIKDLERRAAKNKLTGLFYGGQGALTSATRSKDFANWWLREGESGPAAKGEFSLMLVINQKSGGSIERYVSYEDVSYAKMEEVLLPPLISYEVLRFEDRSDAALTTRDPRWPNATHVAYLIER